MNFGNDGFERYWSLPDIKLHRRNIGASPPLIMLYGITANGCGWDLGANRLASRFHAIKLDRRHHRRSRNSIVALYNENGIAGHVARPNLVSAGVTFEFTRFLEDYVMDRLDEGVVGRDDKFFSPATCKRTRGLRTDVPAVTVGDAYHDVPEKQPAEIVCLIENSPQNIKSLRCMGDSENE